MDKRIIFDTLMRVASEEAMRTGKSYKEGLEIAKEVVGSAIKEATLQAKKLEKEMEEK